MVQLLYKYLILNRELSLPGIGRFSFTREPASFDFANKLFVAPGSHIVFRAGADVPTPQFYNFISNEQKIDEAEAIQKVDAFTNQLLQNLSAKETVELPGVGILFQNEQGEVSFEASAQVRDYFPDVSAEVGATSAAELNLVVPEINTPAKIAGEPVMDEDVAVKKKSTWWIYALILALIGIAAIVYYYLQNGSLQ